MKVLGIISSLSILIPSTFLLLNFKSAWKHQTLFSIYLLICLFVELLLLFLLTQNIQNLGIVNVFTAVEGFILLVVIGTWFQKYLSKILAIAPAFLFLVFAIYSLMLFQESGFLKALFVTERIALSVFAATLLITTALKGRENIFFETSFWALGAIFLFFTTTVTLYAATEQIFKSDHWIAHYFGYIYSFANIASNILYCIAILCLPQKQVNKRMA